ncbi:hypothetical protein [Enterococcus sp. DIV0788_1]
MLNAKKLLLVITLISTFIVGGSTFLSNSASVGEKQSASYSKTEKCKNDLAKKAGVNPNDVELDMAPQ